MSKVLIFFLIALCQAGFAQDERFYRGIFFGTEENKPQADFKYEVRSPDYMIDLDRDGVVDSFQTVKKDGVDYIRIRDANGMTRFEANLDAKGKNSLIFKAQLKRISSQADALILHYYEGDTLDAVFEGSARLYILTIRDRDLRKIHITKGPYFWTERESASDHYHKYWNRRYTVNTLDYNHDGINEISISFNKIHRIMRYEGFGNWSNL